VARIARLHGQFQSDFRAHAEWLAGEGRYDWLANLWTGIEEVADRIRQFPEIGPMLRQDRRLVLRKLIFRRLPYVAWYAYRRQRPIGDVWLVRLFGARQDRPDPDPSTWTLSS
jgi:plasmid stabilization system protein ParE